ncbi:MAG TPA: SelB C-terminal domain-containing protein, partial [Methylibium sp.]
WLCTPEVALSSDRIDARLSLWHGEARSLRSGASVHVHLGASDVMGSVAMLDEGDALAPGAAARVQLVLREPIGVWRGERIVLRDASASRTLAGGVVLDPEAPQRYRRTAQRLAALAAWEAEEPAERLRALLHASPGGVDLEAWLRAEGRVATALPALPVGVLRGGDANADWALAAAHAEALRTAVLDALAAFHRQQPDELGPDTARLRRLAAPRLAEPLWRVLLTALQREGAVMQHGAQLHLPEHGVQLSAQEQRIAQKVLPRLEAGGFDPPWVRDLAADTRESEALLRAVLARLARRGELHQVVKDLYYPAGTMKRLAQLARERAGPDGELTAASFRDATQLGRKRAIQILEFFDRVGLLRRVHDAHRLRSDCSLFVEQEPR